jgi:hypothetical protein
MSAVGYQFLCKHLNLSAFSPRRPARLATVSRLTRQADALLVPQHAAPNTQDALTHVLFALKHEGVNLQILSQTLKKIPPNEVLNVVQATPSSRYVRVLGFLWEAFNEQTLEGDFVLSGPTVDVFDSSRYLTAPGERNARWRVNFNGLGSLNYCATVERTAEIETLLGLQILERAQTFIDSLADHATDRALAWAYLHETESSFAIERESPTQGKAEAFVTLLKQAHTPRQMDEDYLVELQNAVISNPFDLAASFRFQQNWLRGPLRGAAGITYIPPPPKLLQTLMKGVLSFANDIPRVIDPLVAASIASFGFVFAHPFMDGNGRLSRFLFHYALCQSGRLAHSLLLPVSVAMKRNESDYLKALQSYSLPMRRHWDVRWVGDDQYDLRFNGDDSLYRYWDATEAVTFGLKMAHQALEQDLGEETKFLDRFDRAYQLVNEQFDVRGNDLTTLTLSCLQHNAILSKNRRKQFRLTVPENVFDAIEKACQSVLAADHAQP